MQGCISQGSNAGKEYHMALTINTNLSSMIVQSNLQKATTSLNSAIERMTTGFKINHAADNAAGYSSARNWEAQ
jgi:flagellin